MCGGIDFRRLIRSDFRVLSGSLRPGAVMLVDRSHLVQKIRVLTSDVFTICLFSVFV